ncbi:condensation domain-containing protein, partial [Micromonospora sp. URMC 107]|uniref:condensation domain-containing protein n=1 Tax=Micromonospora sp. URMC 107 TaxID=3423418 RepID=UPI003F1A9AAF
PLAVDIHPHHTFRQLLHHSRTVLMHAVTHQDIPFDKLVEGTRPTPDRHTPPLIQTVFTTMDGTDAAPLHTATMRPLPIDEGVAKFDLAVQVQVEPDVVRVFFDYACDLYEPATMAELADSYRALVAAVLAEPDRPLSTVVAVTDAQRERLADALTASPVAVPPGDLGCVPRLVADAAARHPDVTAIVDGAGALTYRELDEWSNHLAHQLLRHGARPDHPV